MKTILPTCDIDLVKSILARDNIYDTLVYDGSPSLNQYVPTGIWYVLCQDDMIAGLINLQKLNNVLWQPHIFIFEQYRGGNSHLWGKMVMAELPYMKFMALTPYSNAKKYAERIGFKTIGILKNSIRKNGQLLNQYILESK